MTTGAGRSRELAGYWPGAWPCEDGGPARSQVVPGSLGARGSEPHATFRPLAGTTMVVERDPGEVFLLAHTFGASTTARVERIDPERLDRVAGSPELPGGPMWPGGIAVAADGHLLTVYGTWVHRLAPDDLGVRAARELPGGRPYNSFVLLADGTVVTKDFAKDGPEPSTLHALDPVSLEPRADPLLLPERSIARLSSDGDAVYVVGDAHLWRLHWAGGAWELDEAFAPAYLGGTGSTYGWDAVLAGGAAWLLDDGEGTERYTGTFRGNGTSRAPLHLVRVGLDSGAVDRAVVCDEPGGLIANPPVVDSARGVAVGYDSGHGVLAGFGTADLSPRWRREQDHACHLLLYEGSGELVTHDHDAARQCDQIVVLDVVSGEELARADTGSPLQSVLFPAPAGGAAEPGAGAVSGAVYSCSFAGVARLACG